MCEKVKERTEHCKKENILALLYAATSELLKHLNALAHNKVH